MNLLHEIFRFLLHPMIFFGHELDSSVYFFFFGFNHISWLIFADNMPEMFIQIFFDVCKLNYLYFVPLKTPPLGNMLL